MEAKKAVDDALREQKLNQMDIKNLWVFHDQIVQLHNTYMNLAIKYPQNRDVRENLNFYVRLIRAINLEIAYRRAAQKPWQRPS